jgi:hypothetical protein
MAIAIRGQIAGVVGDVIAALAGLAIERGGHDPVERGQHRAGARGLLALDALGIDSGEDQRKRAQQRKRQNRKEHHCEPTGRRAPYAPYFALRCAPCRNCVVGNHGA